MPLNPPFDELLNKPLRQDDPTPLYFQLYSLLKNNILNGTIEDEQQLPTELALSASLSISRITAKRALDELAAERLVTRQRAKGTYVTHKYVPKPVKAPLVGMLQEIESMARHSNVKVLEVAETLPPASIREEFGLASGETALKMTRVRIRDDEPFGYYASWSLGLRSNIDKKTLATTPRLEIFRQNGIEIAHVRQILTAEAASADVAAELQVTPGFPLLSMLRRSFDRDEKLVDYLHALYHPDRFQYNMDLTLDQSQATIHSPKVI